MLLGTFCTLLALNVYADSVGSDYQDFKNSLNKKYGFDYNLDVSVLGQRTSPSGKNNAVQAYIYPEFAWTTFDNKYGTGTLNFAYTVIRYGNHNAADLANNSGYVTGINDYTGGENQFDELYYTYQLGGKWDWLTVALGQFPLYNFDGTEYDANQQVNFLMMLWRKMLLHLILRPGWAAMFRLRQTASGTLLSVGKMPQTLMRRA